MCFGDHEETCPVKAVTAWMKAGGIGDGPLFRPVRWSKVQDTRLSDKAVARMVKRYGSDIGLEPSKFSGHLLRAGLVTSAIQAGVDPLDVQRHSGHASLDMLKRCIRDATVFEEIRQLIGALRHPHNSSVKLPVLQCQSAGYAPRVGLSSAADRVCDTSRTLSFKSFARALAACSLTISPKPHITASFCRIYFFLVSA